MLLNRAYMDAVFGHYYALSKDTQLCEADRVILFWWMEDHLNL